MKREPYALPKSLWASEFQTSDSISNYGAAMLRQSEVSMPKNHSEARMISLRGRWINYAASLWALLFAAPHVWWALGFPFGFPGGPARARANHQLMMTTWRYYFDLAVIFLGLLAILVSLALIRTWGRTIPRWILRTMAWIASAMLTLRGVAGLVVDGTSDPVWWPTFLVGGILFGSVAWTARRPRGAPDPEGTV